MNWLAFILWTGIVILVLLPPRYDPAIRLKEWLEEDVGTPTKTEWTWTVFAAIVILAIVGIGVLAT